MTLTTQHDSNTAHTTLSISGHFTFHMHREFTAAIKTIDTKARRVTVDLSGAEYMDSAGLGLLVQMHNKLGATEKILKIAQGSLIDDILRVANFDKLFAINYA